MSSYTIFQCSISKTVCLPFFPHPYVDSVTFSFLHCVFSITVVVSVISGEVYTTSVTFLDVLVYHHVCLSGLAPVTIQTCHNDRKSPSSQKCVFLLVSTFECWTLEGCFYIYRSNCTFFLCSLNIWFGEVGQWAWFVITNGIEATSGQKFSRHKCEIIWNFLMREKEKVPL